MQCASFEVLCQVDPPRLGPQSSRDTIQDDVLVTEPSSCNVRVRRRPEESDIMYIILNVARDMHGQGILFILTMLAVILSRHCFALSLSVTDALLFRGYTYCFVLNCAWDTRILPFLNQCSTVIEPLPVIFGVNFLASS